MKEWIKLISVILFMAFLVWIAISSAIFRFRHPWATDTELFLHTGDALILRKVPYNEMRPRE